MSCGHSFCKTCSMSTEECPMDNKKMTPVSKIILQLSIFSIFKKAFVMQARAFCAMFLLISLRDCTARHECTQWQGYWKQKRV